MNESEQQGQWRIKVAAGEFGPVNLMTLRDWARQGRVLPHDFVLDPVKQAWIPASDVPELQGVFPAGGPEPTGLPRPAPRARTGLNVGCLIGIGVAVIFALIVLAGILLPVMARSREMARRSTCLNNLKQLGLAMRQYSQDFAGAYPWRTGASDPADAWCDLGLLYPNYVSDLDCFLCPSSQDESWDPDIAASSGGPYRYEFRPFQSDDTTSVISYAYCFDRTRPWTESARSTVRLLADKKAGSNIASYIVDTEGKRYEGKNPVSKANHRDDGRNVLYQDGHVKWRAGIRAIDPDEDDDEVGEAYLRDYTDWWSDPPFYGE